MRPVILCGGSGSRLWPLSKPKQFQKIFSQNTMFHNTLLRLKSDYMPPIISTNIQYESLVMEELHALQEYKVIFEPVKIGTAAAILIAALLCNENETMLILPSDHFIGDLNSFYASTQKASKLASETNSMESRPGELPSWPLPEPYVKLALHKAPTSHCPNPILNFQCTNRLGLLFAVLSSTLAALVLCPLSFLYFVWNHFLSFLLNILIMLSSAVI